jgi:hypothetical protein
MGFNTVARYPRAEHSQQQDGFLQEQLLRQDGLYMRQQHQVFESGEPETMKVAHPLYYCGLRVRV